MMKIKEKTKNSVRKRADEIKQHRCKNLIAVIENPKDMRNVGTIIRNVNALGVEKIYIVDSRHSLPVDWEKMKEWKKLLVTSGSAIKYSFTKRFNSTEECLSHLNDNNFSSIVTSPHKKNVKTYYLDDVDYTRFKKLAVWFGNESRGISDLANSSSKFCITIPMFGMVESLNLGTTTGIVLYEITKQRRNFQYKRFKKI